MLGLLAWTPLPLVLWVALLAFGAALVCWSAVEEHDRD